MELNKFKDIISGNPKDVLKLIDNLDKRENLIKNLWKIASNTNEPKALIKSSKKALYLLRSKGIDVDFYKPKIETIVEKSASETSVDQAFLTFPDSPGNNLLVLAIEDTRKTAKYFYKFIINSMEGIKRFSFEKVSRKFIEKFRDSNPDFFPILVDYAVYRLNKALKITDKSKITGISKLPSILILEDEKAVEHPAIKLAPSNISRIARPMEESKLFERDEIAGLVIPEGDLEDYKNQIMKAKSSRLIIQNRSPEERVADVVERFYRDYFTHERLLFYIEILLDIAYCFYQKKLLELSGILVDYAKSLMYQNINIKEHPFISFLVSKAFYPLK